MSDTFRVDPPGMDAAAGRFTAAAEAIADVDVAGPFAAIDAALPGSATSVAALWTSTRMGATVQVLGERVQGTADGVRASVANYRATDATGSELFGGPGR